MPDPLRLALVPKANQFHHDISSVMPYRAKQAQCAECMHGDVLSCRALGTLIMRNVVSYYTGRHMHTFLRSTSDIHKCSKTHI